jgi:integrase
MDKGAGWSDPHQSEGIRRMGRGTGVRAGSGSSITIDFRYRGVRCREKLKLEPTPPNRAYARKFRARILHEIALGTFDYAQHFPESSRVEMFADPSRPVPVKLEKYLDSYVDSLEGHVEPETLADYREYAKVLIATGWGRRSLQDLTRAEIREWAQGLKVSRKRLNNLLIPLRGALRQAADDGVLEVNPLAQFKLGRRVEIAKEVVDPLTPAELALLCATEYGYLWQFWAWTGLRTSELIGLQWPDVDRSLARATVWRAVVSGREKGTKTSSGKRVVTLLAPAREALAGRRADLGLVFRKANGKPFTSDKAIRIVFHAACDAAGIRRRRGPYVLRHTFASLALSAGEPLGWVSAQMGHKDPWMTLRVYAKWVPSAFPDAGDRMVAAVKKPC